MNITQFQYAEPVYQYFQDGEITVNYSFLSRALTEQAIKESVIQEKEYITVTKLHPDDTKNQVTVETKVYRLLEN